MRLLDPDPASRLGGEELLALLGVAPDGEQAAPDQEFVGRIRERSLLANAWRAVRGGGTAVVHVSGASGMGKSALLTQFLAGIDATGEALLLSGRCYEQELVPYKALDSLVDELAVYLGGLGSRAAPLLLATVSDLVKLFPVLTHVRGVGQQEAGRNACEPGRAPPSYDWRFQGHGPAVGAGPSACGALSMTPSGAAPTAHRFSGPSSTRRWAFRSRSCCC